MSKPWCHMALIAPCRELAHSLGYKLASDDHKMSIQKCRQICLPTFIPVMHSLKTSQNLFLGSNWICMYINLLLLPAKHKSDWYRKAILQAKQALLHHAQRSERWELTHHQCLSTHLLFSHILECSLTKL